MHIKRIRTSVYSTFKNNNNKSRDDDDAYIYDRFKELHKYLIKYNLNKTEYVCINTLY